jgi:1-phosphofructokinase
LERVLFVENLSWLIEREECVVVLSGSLCGGLETDFYAHLIELARKNKRKVYLDADGDAFRTGLEAKPHFIKPNLRELLEYFKVEDTKLEPQGLKPYCLKIIKKGIERVALSMGEGGAIFADAKKTFFCPALDVPVKSTVGAGDSMMGAFALAEDRKLSFKDAVTLAMAASAGACMTGGTNPPDQKLVATLVKQVKLVEL